MWSMRQSLHFIAIREDCPHIYVEANMSQAKEGFEIILQYCDNELFTESWFCQYIVWFTRFEKLSKELQLSKL